MSFEQSTVSGAEKEKGISACMALKEKESDSLHWGNIVCDKMTREEALLVAKFDALKKNPSQKQLFSLDTEARELLETTGSAVAEVLINELVALMYTLKHQNEQRS